jgi:hypothetical protein
MIEATGKALDNIAGSTDRELIEAQLAEERAARNSLEGRGQNLITSAGVLATLLFGLAAFAVGAGKVQLDIWDRVALILSLALFVGASVAASMTAAPSKRWREASLKALRQRVEPDDWYATDIAEAARRNAKLEVRIFEAAREVNRSKALWLRRAVRLEVGALVSLAVAVGLAVVRVH